MMWVPNLGASRGDSLHVDDGLWAVPEPLLPERLSTIRKLCRRLGPEVVEAITRAVIAKAMRERRFVVRAARCDSTVVEADVRYPTDLGLAAAPTRALAREAAKVKPLTGATGRGVRDRSRAVGRRLRLLNRTLARRAGQGKELALRLTGEAGELVRRSVAETRRVAAGLRSRARGRGARARLAAGRRPPARGVGRARREGRAPDRPAARR
jgi:hypothetical protein